MYFFYFDESGNRDPEVSGVDATGKAFAKDYIYVLLAICLHESRWGAFDQEISDAKLALRAKLHKQKNIALPSLADCEVKSTALRINKTPGQKGHSSFVSNLEPEDKKHIANLYYSQIEKHHMRIFATVVDKRHLNPGTTAEFLHKKAYELTLERIEHFMTEYHSNERGLIVMDDTQTQLNHAVAMKHASFLRDGNTNLTFRHLVEYPFFTDSKLSNGIQFADLCAYNTYRAFRHEDFAYTYFEKTIPAFYRSRKSTGGKIDGLKVWPDASPLIAIAREKCWRATQSNETKNPPRGGLNDAGLGLTKHSSISSLQEAPSTREPS